MIDICSECDLDYKLEQCCGSNPDTGEYEEKIILGRRVNCCNFLDADGLCSVYDQPSLRPQKCEDYFCPRMNFIDTYSFITREK